MRRFPTLLIVFGIIAIVASLIVLGLTYFPIIYYEIKYALARPSEEVQISFDANSDKFESSAIVPVSTDFSVIVPKIGANAKVVQGVDPFNSVVYQRALTKGVAHAKGSALPGESGNIFLFSHSSVDFYLATRYNSIFYLLNKLEKGDNIFVVYNGVNFKYEVKNLEIVSSERIDYIKDRELKDNKSQSLILMTCWPPGTSVNRLIVVSELIEI